MKHLSLLVSGLICLCVCVSSCSKVEEVYPGIITEMADVYTDSHGVIVKFITDAGVTYQVTDGQDKLEPDAIYRILCGYVPSGENATIFQAQGVYILRDSSAVAKTDPTAVKSVWKGGKYINMYLSPLTQGGTQYWGFITDSIKGGHAWLSLHHDQNADPLSYTQPTYASLPIDSIRGIQEGDVITLTIKTFNGTASWNFRK